MLVAAMNPCPCGNLSNPLQACVCTPGAITKYRRRISGPLLDRIDLMIEVGPVAAEKLDGAGARMERDPSTFRRAWNERAGASASDFRKSAFLRTPQ
jgi:predicted ATPase with chaperone activity